MKELHKCLNMVLKAKESGVNGLLLEIAAHFDSIEFRHINSDCITIKRLSSYYDDLNKNFEFTQLGIYPFPKFMIELETYLNETINTLKNEPNT